MEKNKDNLRDALNKLPEYEPQGNLWQHIEGKLNAAESPKVLADAVANLPEYDPPGRVWEAVERVLEADAAATKGGGLFALRLRKYAAAAAILLLIGAFYFSSRGILTGGETIEYAEETIEDDLLKKNNTTEDDEAFAEILAMCEMQSFACTQPVFQSLKNELEELTAARDMLREALAEYDANADLMMELKEIEMLRTDLLKQLAAEVA